MVHLLLSSHIIIHSHIYLGPFLLVNDAWSVNISLLIETRWSFHRRKLNYGWRKQWFEVKNILIMDLFLTNLQFFTSQDISWWTGVLWITCVLLWCFYQLFGFWRHPFTAEHPLLSKWCNAKHRNLFWWRNKLFYILRIEGEYIFSKCSFLGELFLNLY